MKRLFLSVAALTSLLFGTASAQDVKTDAEKEAVKKAVETYLYAEETDEKKSPLSGEAKIFSIVGPSPGRIKATPLSKPEGKRPKGSKTLRSPQRIVSIEVLSDGASVKVATDYTPDDKTDGTDDHFQLIWLLKAEGEWKVVGILMPSTTLHSTLTGDAEKEAIRKSVELYLYGEEAGAKRDVLDEGIITIPIMSKSHCIKIMPDSERAIEVSDPKNPQDSRAILRIDVSKYGWGAATIYTDHAPNGKTDESDAGCQQLWLSKVKGVWKINTILLPEHITSAERN